MSLFTKFKTITQETGNKTMRSAQRTKLWTDIHSLRTKIESLKKEFGPKVFDEMRRNDRDAADKLFHEYEGKIIAIEHQIEEKEAERAKLQEPGKPDDEPKHKKDDEPSKPASVPSDDEGPPPTKALDPPPRLSGAHTPVDRASTESPERSTPPVTQPSEPTTTPTPTPSASTDSAKVLYDFTTSNENEVAVSEGEIVTIQQRGDTGWWYIQKSDGSVGFVPTNYLEEL
ncbi:hypothetical protein Pelo_8156 [Pelomyxa schiedti]|nr:hypothetical protein Pelo_8156 [Pelomyxa schiedti]